MGIDFLAVIADAAVGEAISKGCGFFGRLMLKRDTQRLREKLEIELLDKYQDELLYNDLSRFLTPKRLSSLMAYCINRAPSDERTKEQFIDEMISHAVPDGTYNRQIRDILLHVMEIVEDHSWERIGYEGSILGSAILRLKDRICRIENAVVTMSQNSVSGGNPCVKNVTSEMNCRLEHELFGNITAADVQSFSNGEYTFAVSPSKRRIIVRILIKYDPKIEKAKSFSEMYNEMAILGIGRQFDVAQARFELEGGTILSSYKDESYDGPVISLPTVYCDSPIENGMTFEDLKVSINPRIEEKRFKICDQYGIVIVQEANYRIERIMKETMVCLRFIGTSNNCSVSITISVNGNKKNDKFYINFDKADSPTCKFVLNIKTLNKHKMRSCLESSLMTKKVLESESVHVIDALSENELMAAKTCNMDEAPSIGEIEYRIELFKKACYLERVFAVSLDSVEEFATLDGETSCLYDLVKNGKAQIPDLNISVKTDDISGVDIVGMNDATFSFTFSGRVEWLGVAIPNIQGQYIISGKVQNAYTEDGCLKFNMGNCFIMESQETAERIAEVASNCGTNETKA